jgi:hypothetical protein
VEKECEIDLLHAALKKVGNWCWCTTKKVPKEAENERRKVKPGEGEPVVGGFGCV